DRDPAVRAAAATAIADRRDPDLDDALAGAAQRDPDLAVRDAAAAAHERLWPWGKQPRYAAGLSLLCPGCGQIYLHEDAEGAMQGVAAAALIATGFVLVRGPTISRDNAADSPKVPIGAELLLLGQ